MANISFYGSHNGSLIIEDKGEILCVIEIERFLNAKNMGLTQYFCPRYIMITLEEILKWVKSEYGITEFENCYFASTDFIGENWKGEHMAFQTNTLINAKNFIHSTHHESHANGVFYQSPYKKALIFSFDGGGDDGKFNVYLGDKEKGVELIEVLKNPFEHPSRPFYDLVIILKIYLLMIYPMVI